MRTAHTVRCTRPAARRREPLAAPPAAYPARRSVADYVLRKELYRGKASTLYQAICRTSGQTVVLKSYSKRRLSNLNWYQVRRSTEGINETPFLHQKCVCMCVRER